MALIYGLFSTGDGQVRFVGQTEYTARKRLDLVVTKALDRQPGALYDWVRDQWRAGHEVHVYSLQDHVIPADLEVFEAYWIEQFSGLLNHTPPVGPARSTSEVGQRVNNAIRARLQGETTGED